MLEKSMHGLEIMNWRGHGKNFFNMPPSKRNFWVPSLFNEMCAKEGNERELYQS